jgi:exodeoxyribonuclease VII large subunit
VQGAEAPAALVAALALAASREEVDVLLLCRGGGSLEDLWAFNDERLVRAIVASPIPVICGVGHETDITLADLAADLRAPTPTAAAELVAPARVELFAVLDRMQQRMHRSTQRSLEGRAMRLDQLVLRLSRPAQVLARHGQSLVALDRRLRHALLGAVRLRTQRQEDVARRLQRAASSRLARAEERLQSLQARLRALDPKRVLSRGYAWISDEQGRAVVSVRGLAAGQQVTAVWADGQASAELTEVRPDDPSQSRG